MKYAYAVVAVLALAAGPAAAQAIGPINITANDASGVCTTANACADFVIGSAPALTIDVSGTWTGTLTFYAAVTTNFRVVTVTSITDLSSVSTTTAGGTWTVPNVGYGVVRVRATAAMTGTAVVVARSGYLSARLAGTTPPLLQVGGTTNAFAAIKRNGFGIDIRKADDSAYGAITASRVILAGSGDIVVSNSAILAVSPGTPTSCGTSPAVASSNGSITQRVTLGTTMSSTCILSLPTAATGWNCHAWTTTTSATMFVQKQTASTTTSATITNYGTAATAQNFADSATLVALCSAY